jgi:hypothetical protein
MMSDPTLRLFRESRANAGTDRAPGNADPEALSLWRRARAIVASGRVNPNRPATWTEEYRKLRSALRRLLQRRAWQANPLDPDVDGREPNPQWDAAGAAAIAKVLDAAIA